MNGLPRVDSYDYVELASRRDDELAKVSEIFIPLVDEMSAMPRVFPPHLHDVAPHRFPRRDELAQGPGFAQLIDVAVQVELPRVPRRRQAGLPKPSHVRARRPGGESDEKDRQEPVHVKHRVHDSPGHRVTHAHRNADDLRAVPQRHLRGRTVKHLSFHVSAQVFKLAPGIQHPELRHRAVRPASAVGHEHQVQRGLRHAHRRSSFASLRQQPPGELAATR